eukprot:TRINITY_DN14781_c0_g1_i2.p1 TRINITY_DN14781_c0_g1~~TRINITY_DN14781_c0_g1_i2.p1  ORF type:complete len:116 (-),score=29.13 TRINITY_DN14781_c0_g1_i2:85-390(-)
MSGFTLLTAAIVGIGGGVGFLKSKSLASLVAGASTGSVLFFASYLISNGERSGHVLAFFVSILLAGIMGRRYGKTGKFMPAGLTAVVMIISILFHASYLVM